MNKNLCKETKSRGKFKRVMCYMCSYQSKCNNYMEYKYGHNDELRESEPLPKEE